MACPQGYWCTPNQWLKRPSEGDEFVERGRKIVIIRGKIVYILYIVSIPYAPELHRENV